MSIAHASKIVNVMVFGIATFLTILFVFAGWLAESVYEWNRGPMEAEVAVGQVTEDLDAYTATRMASSNFPTKIIWGAMIAAICITWIVAVAIWYFKVRLVDL